MTSCVGHLLDKWFKGDALKGELGYHGSVGNFQSPYTPGTAYVLLHHVFGEATGVKGAWGQAIGGRGTISEAIARMRVGNYRFRGYSTPIGQHHAISMSVLRYHFCNTRIRTFCLIN